MTGSGKEPGGIVKKVIVMRRHPLCIREREKNYACI